MVKLEMLSTFSITVSAQPGEALNRGFWLDLRYLDVLLKALPASLTSLELDLAFSDIPGDGEPTHLCPTIRLLLPQLKDLRLRLKTVCQELLANSTDAPLKASKLHSFTMNTNDYIKKTSTCAPGEKLNFHKRVAYPLNSAHHEATATAPRMEARFYEGYEIDEWEEDEYGLDPSAYEADHWNHHDVLAKKTYRYPVMRVGGPDERGDMLRIRGHIEEYGDQRAIEQKVEGPAWMETVGGARLPASFAASESAISQNYVWQDLRLDSRQDFQQRSKFGLEIWDVEKENGLWLVDVEELDHF
ncbi:MAG: hypothetical protein Q9169_008092 [Polycauliona sp. 2 TL-2023]